MEQHSIILFDGVCNLCNGFVQFIVKRDIKAHFKFASLQSDIGQDLLTKYQLSKDLDTVVLIRNNKAYTKSGAGLRVLSKLGALWPLMIILLVVPYFIRNFVYDWVARNRYKWYGKKDQCMMPSPELKKRFL
ncbi:MAG: thiol-disulfide oxidoreductase DCC family protein [Aureispira sp.]|nr:thiol-disulfide oxidoreductase DCC family protein [Aureispira sp.]